MKPSYKQQIIQWLTKLDITLREPVEPVDLQEARRIVKGLVRLVRSA